MHSAAFPETPLRNREDTAGILGAERHAARIGRPCRPPRTLPRLASNGQCADALGSESACPAPCVLSIVPLAGTHGSEAEARGSKAEARGSEAEAHGGALRLRNPRKAPFEKDPLRNPPHRSPGTKRSSRTASGNLMSHRQRLRVLPCRFSRSPRAPRRKARRGYPRKRRRT